MSSSALDKGNNSVSTPEAQVRVREVKRVKEFPAGNTVTSSSRIAFLNSLCSLPKFKALLDLVPAVVRVFLGHNFELSNFANFSQGLQQFPTITLHGLVGKVERLIYLPSSIQLVPSKKL